MRMRHMRIIVMTILLAPCTVFAQQWPSIVRTLDWVEVYTGTNTPVANPNGILEPGESARLMVSASYSPPAGTPIEPGSPSRVAGLARSTFTLGPVLWEEELGNWNHHSSQAPFEPWFKGGMGFQIVSVAQESQGGAWMPDPINPVPGFFQAVWTPLSYEPRHVSMRVGTVIPAFSQVWIHSGTDPTTGFPILSQLTVGASIPPQIHIPIVIPAPGAAVAVMLGGGAVLLRSRRRAAACPARGCESCRGIGANTAARTACTAPDRFLPPGVQ